VSKKVDKELKLKSAAVLTIKRADEMTPAGRKAIAAWLRRHAAMLLKDGKDYAPTFRGRYLYR
jgi:hypothetical protein